MPLSGDTAVVGSDQNDAFAHDPGAAYVFTRSAGVWTQQQRLQPSDLTADDLFGGRVALSGDTAVISSLLDDNSGGVNAGSAYVFVTEAPNVAPVVNAGSDQSSGEGVAFNLTATFTDGNASDTHAANVNWGDGSPAVAATVVEPSGQNAGTVNASHVYLAPGVYTITVTVTDSGSASGSDTLQVTVAPAPTPTPTPTLVPPINPGQIIIGEFRLRGTAGQADEFIKLYNNTDSEVVVADANPSTCATQTLLTPPLVKCGWSVVDLQGAASNNPRLVIPAGTTIPARGHYLAAGTVYGLSAAATPDQTYEPPAYSGAEADYTGLALYRTADRGQFSPTHLLDAVGFDAVAPTFREGMGLLPTTGITSDIEHSFVRNQASGLPADTGNNRSDFVLVATDPSLATGANAVLGVPGPEALASPVQRNSGFSVTVPPDISASLRQTSSPVPNGDLGTLSLRRRFINQTGQQIRKLRFRVTDLTTINSPAIFISQADVRVLDATLSGLSSTTLKAATLDPAPAQNRGGGVNASLVVSGSLTLSQALAPNDTVDIEFLLGVMRSGSYRFIISVEALP